MKTVRDMEQQAYFDTLDAAAALKRGDKLGAALKLGRAAGIRDMLGYTYVYQFLAEKELSSMIETAHSVGRELGFKSV